MSKIKWRMLSRVAAASSSLFMLATMSIFACLSLVLNSSLVYANNPEVDQVNITVPVSCTMDGSGMNSHIANIDNNNYETEIGSTTITTYCNDTNGFSIYAIGYSNDEYGNTDMIGTSTEELIHTGTTLDGTTSNWAMKLSTDPNATYPVEIQNSYNNYKVVPTTYTLVAKRESSTDLGTAAIGSILTTTYAASVSPTQVADTYIGKVRYTLVHPYNEIPLQPQVTESGKICYYANANDAEGTMGCQTIPTSGGTADTVTPTSATLLASNFSRQGYGFAGWSNKFDYATNPNQEGIKFYGPNETISFTAGQYSGTNNGLSLYAVWIKSVGSLQDSSKVTELCGNTAQSIAGSLTTAPTDGTASLSSVSALTDQRDNNTYAIAKLADGECWMIENLRLESTAEHNSDGPLAQGYGTSATYGNFGGLADAESANFSSSTTANSLYYSGTQSGTASINIGTTNYPGYRMPRYNNLNTSTRASNPTNNDGNMYSYGNYYTWHAAIADLTYNGTNNRSTTGTSLCPAGWHLPTGGMAYASGGTSGVNVTGNTSTFREFYNLGYKIMDEVKTAYEDTPSGGLSYYSSNTTNTAGKTATTAFRSFPNNFLFSGIYNTLSAYGRGSSGGCWSSTAGNYYNSYLLYLNSSYVYPGAYNNYKSYGRSIRCTIGS